MSQPDGQPTPTVQIVQSIGDMDPLEQILRLIEADEDALGWDQRPTFWSLARDVNGVAVSPLMLPFVALYESPPDALMPFARAAQMALEGLDSDDARDAVLHMVPRAFYGIVLITEGWTVPDSMNRMDEFQNRVVYEAPDRIEERILIAVLTDGGVASIRRTRGATPEYIGPDEMDAQHGGRVVDGLRLLVTVFDGVIHAG